jgi:hypothetical protein
MQRGLRQDRLISMPEIDSYLGDVRRLRAQGFGRRRIAATLGIGPDQAQRLLKKMELEDARKPGANLPTVIEIEPRTAPQFAQRIRQRWQESVEAIFQVARLLIDAKAQLAHGEFRQMIEQNLPFGPRAANMLMCIGNDQRLVNGNHGSLLPASGRTLYELTKLDDATLEEAIADGTIRDSLERANVERIAKAGQAQGAISGHRALMANRMPRDDDALDYYPTPPWATRALLEEVINNVGVRRQSAWEPACGEGHMVAPLEEYFRQVDGSDIHDYNGNARIDFVGAHKLDDIRYDWIITNPPFKEDLAERFILRAIDLAREGVAMFVRVQFLETVGRYERIFHTRPPTIVAMFAERVNLRKGYWDPDGDTATAYCWLVWVGKEMASPTRLMWIPPGCRERLTRATDRERFAAWSLKEAAE